MKHIPARSTLAAILLSAAITLPLSAADNLPIETRWERVCAVARNQELVLTTEKGETIQGYCVSVDVNKVAVRTAGSIVVDVSRTTLAKLEMRRPKAHQLRSLGRGMRRGLHEGAKELFSPLAPAGMVLIPGTLAWGAMAAPFCILGDLFATDRATHEIKLLAPRPGSPHDAYSH